MLEMQGKWFVRHSLALVRTPSSAWAADAFVADQQGSGPPRSWLPSSPPAFPAPLGHGGKREQEGLARAREKWLVMPRWEREEVTGWSGTKWGEDFLGRVTSEVGAEALLCFWLCCSADRPAFCKRGRTA